MLQLLSPDQQLSFISFIFTTEKFLVQDWVLYIFAMVLSILQSRKSFFVFYDTEFFLRIQSLFFLVQQSLFGGLSDVSSQIHSGYAFLTRKLSKNIPPEAHEVHLHLIS